MKFGICCTPAAFTPAPGEEVPGLARLMDVLGEAGADYVEFGVATVQPEADAGVFETLRSAMEKYPLRSEAFNSFIPGSYPIIGDSVNLKSVLGYCETALQRCRALGGESVVLGSGAARRVPEGYDRGVARNQFVTFCRELGPIADAAGITIAIEPLNKKEDNFLNSVAEGAELVDEIAHPRIQLLADLYHMSQDGEPLEHAAEAGSRLRHTHAADRGRIAAGFAPDGEEDFIGFFRNLRAAGYDGPNARCSFEGQFGDIEKQAAPVIALFRQRWDESASA